MEGGFNVVVHDVLAGELSRNSIALLNAEVQPSTPEPASTPASALEHRTRDAMRFGTNHIVLQYGVDCAEAGPGPCQGKERLLNRSAMRVTYITAGPMRDLRHDIQPEKRTTRQQSPTAKATGFRSGIILPSPGCDIQGPETIVPGLRTLR